MIERWDGGVEARSDKRDRMWSWPADGLMWKRFEGVCELCRSQKERNGDLGSKARGDLPAVSCVGEMNGE